MTPQYAVAIWLGDRSDYSEAQATTTTAASVFGDFIDKMISPTQTVKFFEAEKPEYKKDYRDEDNHIGGYYSSKKKKDDTEVTTKQDDEETPEGDGDENGGNEGGEGNEGGGNADRHRHRRRSLPRSPSQRRSRRRSRRPTQPRTTVAARVPKAA